jgi:hypothetical protein
VCAEGVEVGGQSKVEVEGEKEAQLQRIELTQRNTPNLSPASEPISCEHGNRRMLVGRNAQTVGCLFVWFGLGRESR